MKSLQIKCALSLLAVLTCMTSSAFAATLYVAPNGNDGWSGTSAEPNVGATDGPLATLAGARDAVRKLKASGALKEAVTVQLRGGTYAISEPVVFAPEDSGTADAPVTYEAYPGEQPVVSGGRAITGWVQEGNLWTADIADVRDGKWAFSALWVNGERRMPARTPNPAHPWGDDPEDSDVFYTAGPVVDKDPATGAESKSGTAFHYKPEDLKAWDSLGDARVVVYHSWETSVLRVKSLDEQNHVIAFTGPAAWPFGYWQNDQRYFVENLFEALDQPGEWYLNKKTGKLYYMPMPGEDMTRAEAVAPVAPRLVMLEGVPAEGKFVEHLAFRGIRFHHTEYTIEPQGHSDGQAASSVGGAIEAVGARQCTIDRCEVGHVGTYGVWFRAGSSRNALTHSEIFDLGAGSVRIGECSSPASENEAADWNRIENCFLHDGGKIFRGAVGFWIGRSSYNRLAHCELCDFRYSGISIGWSWGYDATSANHNIVEYNHVHHVGHGQLSDMGAIYTLGVSPGTVIQHNVFHDVMSNPRVSGGWGIYFDEGSTDILAEDNLVYNTLTGTLHQHYGRDNRIQNNIFAFSHRGQLIRSREENHYSFFFERNIVYFNNGQLLGSNWGNGKFFVDGNCYWDATGDDVEFAGRSFDEWKGIGHDPHSVVADPLFVNAEGEDFRLKAESPAIKLGFMAFDPSEAGLYGEAEWTAKPKQIARPPFAPPKPPEPTASAFDFEGLPLNAPPPGAEVHEEGAGTIRVTDETAATGKQSIKFTDAPGLKLAFNPHLVLSPHFRSGAASAAFNVRLEPGAVFFHEWRDNHNPYRIGPSVWMNGKGEISSGGKVLTTVPVSQWLQIAIVCPLGRGANGTFSMTVTVPGQAPRQFDALACGNPAFRKLDWLGFVSNANDTTTTYLDDVRVEGK